MIRILLLAALACAACTPTSNDPGETASPAPVAKTFATQIEAPAPDYSALIAKPPARPKGELLREASAPLPSDAKAIGETWRKRLEAKRAIGGYGLAGKGEDGPIDSISVLMTATDFDAWVAENGWQVPAHIRWDFNPELVAPRITPEAEAKVRIWPASTVRTGAQLEALLGGYVYVRDGCFYMKDPDATGKERLAWFLAETGLDVDAEGYLVLVNRHSGEIMARLGENMNWGGPNFIAEDDPKIAELKRQCGDLEVVNVGNPMSTARWNDERAG